MFAESEIVEKQDCEGKEKHELFKGSHCSGEKIHSTCSPQTRPHSTEHSKIQQSNSVIDKSKPKDDSIETCYNEERNSAVTESKLDSDSIQPNYKEKTNSAVITSKSDMNSTETCLKPETGCNSTMSIKTEDADCLQRDKSSKQDAHSVKPSFKQEMTCKYNSSETMTTAHQVSMETATRSKPVLTKTSSREETSFKLDDSLQNDWREIHQDKTSMRMKGQENVTHIKKEILEDQEKTKRVIVSNGVKTRVPCENHDCDLKLGQECLPIDEPKMVGKTKTDKYMEDLQNALSQTHITRGGGEKKIPREVDDEVDGLIRQASYTVSYYGQIAPPQSSPQNNFDSFRQNGDINLYQNVTSSFDRHQNVVQLDQMRMDHCQYPPTMSGMYPSFSCDSIMIDSPYQAAIPNVSPKFPPNEDQFLHGSINGDDLVTDEAPPSPPSYYNRVNQQIVMKPSEDQQFLHGGYLSHLENGMSSKNYCPKYGRLNDFEGQQEITGYRNGFQQQPGRFLDIQYCREFETARQTEEPKNVVGQQNGMSSQNHDLLSANSIEGIKQMLQESTASKNVVHEQNPEMQYEYPQAVGTKGALYPQNETENHHQVSPEMQHRDENGENFLHHLPSLEEEKFILLFHEIRHDPSFLQALNTKNRMQQTPLYCCVQFRKHLAANYYINSGADPNIQGCQVDHDTNEWIWQGPIHKAVENGDFLMVSILMQSQRLDINAERSSDRKSPMMVALQKHIPNCEERDNTEIIKLLIENNADLTKVDTAADRSILMSAVESKDINVIRRILEKVGPMVARHLINAKNKDGNTSMHILAGLKNIGMEDHVALGRLLVKNGGLHEMNNEKPNGMRPNDWNSLLFEEIRKTFQ